MDKTVGSIISSASIRSVLSVLAWSFLKLLPDHYHMPDRAGPDLQQSKTGWFLIPGSLEVGEKAVS